MVSTHLSTSCSFTGGACWRPEEASRPGGIGQLLYPLFKGLQTFPNLSCMVGMGEGWTESSLLQGVMTSMHTVDAQPGVRMCGAKLCI